HVAADSKASLNDEAKSAVRFAPPSANLVVAPDKPYSVQEKRSMWYTFKELQSRHRSDVDEIKRYRSDTSTKQRHSLLPLHQQDNGPDNTISWRGLEHVVADANNNNSNTHHNKLKPSRSDRVKETVRQIVQYHKQAVAKGLPLLNDELRQLSQHKTKADRQRAERWALQDAKDIGIKMRTLACHHSTTLRAVGKVMSPTRQMKKVSHKLVSKLPVLPWGQ
ncbi:expressed unknown protein (Partial), partial [Seminavis robusta]